MKRRVNLRNALRAKQKRTPALVSRRQLPQRAPINVVCVCAGGVVSSGDLAKAFLKATKNEKQPFNVETAGFYIPQHYDRIRSANIILTEIEPSTLRQILERFEIRTLARLYQASPNPRKMAKLKETIFNEER